MRCIHVLVSVRILYLKFLINSHFCCKGKCHMQEGPVQHNIQVLLDDVSFSELDFR